MLIILPCRWLTAFIFLAQNFNQVSCSVSRWNGEVVCSRKYAAEAFSFIALLVCSMIFRARFANWQQFRLAGRPPLPILLRLHLQPGHSSASGRSQGEGEFAPKP